MTDKEHYVQIINADESHNEILNSMCQVLEGLGIDCFEDEEEAEKRDCDIFLRFQKRSNNENNI
jgi:hypothetical protein